MRKQRGGSIIKIRSIAGRIVLPYVSTIFAIEGLSESMAYELEPFFSISIPLWVFG
jgi:short-subunit dehydrogenase